jgi:excinuclease ABC subunit C
MRIATTPRPKPEQIPDHPGVYLFRDAAGRVIYVGKAISLRKRVASYFQPLRNLHPRTAAMVDASASLEWVLVQNEVEALQLEYNLIKQHRPRYNVRYRDDKTYPWLAVTVSEEYPRPRVERGAKRKGTRYFGPYTHAYAIRETLDLLLRTFPMRTCSQGVFDRQRRLGRPCILYDINKCSGPCVGHISTEDHREIVEEFISFMEGRTRPVLRRLDEQMRDAAEGLNFEMAARLRDQLASVRKAMERQQMVSSSPEDFDIAAFAEDDLEAAVQVFFVRRGRVVGQRGFVVDKVEELDTAELASTFVQQLYGDREDQVPREILLPVLPDGADALRQWLAGLRGGPVDFRVPQRGEKRALLETVTANAKESFTIHKLKRSSDFDARARALKEIQEHLDLPVAPLRIECYDISNLQGNQVVGSMVVFEDALPRKSEYRRFQVRTVGGQDDFASLREVLSRRLARLASENQDQGAAADAEEAELAAELGAAPDTGEAAARDAGEAAGPGEPSAEQPRSARKFAYPPSLIVVDGGRPQLAAAMEALEEAGRTDLPVIGLAKRMEEVYVPGSPDPIVLPRTSEGLYLLQRVRDEAHRFAIAYHRKLRGRSMTTSALDGIPGVGEGRRKQLVRHFGSPRKVSQATVEEIAEVPGFGPRLARTVWDHIHGARASRAPQPQGARE